MYRTVFKIDRPLNEIFSRAWNDLLPHLAPMSLVWAVFYIPTNLFVLLRSGDMVRHLNSGSSAVIPVMLLLSLLGNIPNIALILLCGDPETEDYNGLVLEAFRRLPLFLTTSLLAMFRMLPLSFLGAIAGSALSAGLASVGVPFETAIYAAFPLMLLALLLAYVRYGSSQYFYLLRGERNMKAVYHSRILFEFNRKKVSAAFGLCLVLPMIVNFGSIYLIDNELFNVLFGFAMGYVIFLSSALYAGIFRDLKESDGDWVRTPPLFRSSPKQADSLPADVEGTDGGETDGRDD